MTYTIAHMEISKRAFDEIHLKMTAAGYDHAVEYTDEGIVLDMTHIGLIVEDGEPEKSIDMGTGEIAILARATGDIEIKDTLVDGDMDIAAVAYIAAFYVLLTNEDAQLMSLLQAQLAANGVFEKKVTKQ